MTVLGKCLVLANLALSVMLAATALGLYANRIDWTNSKATGDGSSGLLTQRSDRIKQLSDALALALLRYEDARTKLLSVEDYRGKTIAYYGNQFDQILTKADSAHPIHQIIGNGLVPASNPAGGPLVSRDKIVNLLQEQKNKIARLNEELDKLVKEDIQVTKELADDRGLRQQVMDQQAEQDRLDQAIEQLKPRLINSIVEVDLLLQRQQDLLSREEELKKAKVARAEP